MDDYATVLTAALERAYGGSAQVHEDDDGGVTAYISGANGTFGFTTGPGRSAIAEVLGIRPPIDPGQ